MLGYELVSAFVQRGFKNIAPERVVWLALMQNSCWLRMYIILMISGECLGGVRFVPHYTFSASC